MNTLRLSSIVIIFILFTSSCIDKHEKADLVLVNGNIYTVNEAIPKAESVAVVDGKIAFVGSIEEGKLWIADSTEVIDLAGKTMTPGLIEGHAHLLGIGKNILNIDLSSTKSYEEVVQMVKDKVEVAKKGEWILGRGWHQDKWDAQPENMIDGFPSHESLSDISPNNPVYLSHASGHAGLANAEAMQLAGVNKKSLNPKGGDILKDLGGNPTGIFNETAQNLIGLIIPKDSDIKNKKALELAIRECLKNGITSFHDAGIDSTEIDLYKTYAKENKLGIRIYAMLAGWNTNLLQAHYDYGPEIGLFDNHLTIRSIKLYADGALGSRGALLLEEYSDAPGVLGLRIQPIEEIRARSIMAYESGFQICTHCIGDRANRDVLDIYDSLTNVDLSKKPMLRYRIEHAQHISLTDIPRFGKIGVIPSMQAIHLSSDRPWAIDRLGKQRIENGAYVWNKLTDSGATVMNGTDAPVEPVSALASFYASVSRQTLAGTPKGGYEADQIMTRTDALKSYTINNAYGAFEENIKGSIEVGKLADFTVFSKDIMEVEPSEILETEIEYTIIGGKTMYKK